MQLSVLILQPFLGVLLHSGELTNIEHMLLVHGCQSLVVHGVLCFMGLILLGSLLVLG